MTSTPLSELRVEQMCHAQPTLDSLIKTFSLPSTEAWMYSLRQWAFGQHAKTAFQNYCVSFLVPCTLSLQDPPAPLPEKIADMELKACHVLGDTDRNTLTADDHALCFCFELLYGDSPHRVWNPLCDPLPAKKARDDHVDFFKPATAAGRDRELNKLARVGPPPTMGRLFCPAVEVLRA